MSHHHGSKRRDAHDSHAAPRCPPPPQGVIAMPRALGWSSGGLGCARPIPRERRGRCAPWAHPGRARPDAAHSAPILFKLNSLRARPFLARELQLRSASAGFTREGHHGRCATTRQNTDQTRSKEGRDGGRPRGAGRSRSPSRRRRGSRRGGLTCSERRSRRGAAALERLGGARQRGDHPRARAGQALRCHRRRPRHVRHRPRPGRLARAGRRSGRCASADAQRARRRQRGRPSEGVGRQR